MTSVKVKFRPSADPDTPGTLFYIISHRGSMRRMSTTCRVLPCEWNFTASSLSLPRSGDRRSALLNIRERIRCDLLRFERIAKKLEGVGLAFSVDDILDEFRRQSEIYTLFTFMGLTIARLEQSGHLRTSETYRAALSSFRRFREDRDLMLDSIKPEVMESYEAYLIGRGVCPNTVSFYMRILRAVYNRAVEDGITENNSPFRNVYTGVDKTVRRALPISAVKKIRTADLSCDPRLDFARDMFMLSFYLRGMSMIDMAFLSKKDILGTHVVYRRHKTGRLLKIRWTREMQQILDKYPVNPTRYLLPIITAGDTNERAAYLNMTYRINCALKKLACKLHLGCNLTMYVARHSWASAAKAKGIPLGVISEGMGHDNENTTLVYLASLDTSVVDRANSLIIKSL